MINNSLPRGVRRRGLTLIELTVVIAAIHALGFTLFISSRSWKRGSDRSGCVLTLRTIQVATRSYQNMYGYSCGGRPCSENGTQDIAEHLHSKGYIEPKLYQQTRGKVLCPADGTYTCPLPDTFPLLGELYMGCSLAASDDHVPLSHTDW